MNVVFRWICGIEPWAQLSVNILDGSAKKMDMIILFEPYSQSILVKVLVSPPLHLTSSPSTHFTSPPLPLYLPTSSPLHNLTTSTSILPHFQSSPHLHLPTYHLTTSSPHILTSPPLYLTTSTSLPPHLPTSTPPHLPSSSPPHKPSSAAQPIFSWMQDSPGSISMNCH